MSYNSKFQKDFIERSLFLVENYTGCFDATILINCLVGLVIVPKECFKLKLTCPINEISKWGIPKTEIKSQTKFYNLNKFIRCLRNAVSHAHFKPIPESGEVTAFKFWDNGGFDITMTLVQLKVFAKRLAATIKDL